MAIKFEKIVPGMILYDVHSHRMGNTSMRSLGVWPVEVVKVDAIRRRALVRWNNNSAEWRSERYLVKLRAKCPEMVTDSAGCQRLRKRDEKGAPSPSGISRKTRPSPKKSPPAPEPATPVSLNLDYVVAYVGSTIPGDYVLWWVPDRSGYTTDFGHAGRYSEKDARSIVNTRPPTEEVAYLYEDVAYLYEDVASIVGRQELVKKRCLAHLAPAFLPLDRSAIPKYIPRQVKDFSRKPARHLRES